MSPSDIHTINGTDGEQKLAKVSTHAKSDGSKFISIKLADDSADFHSAPAVCSGVGPFYSLKPINGKPKADCYYDHITWETIVEMAKDPQTTAKEQSRWIIPSTYNRYDARSNEIQAEKGEFVFICLDIDSGGPSLDQLVNACDHVWGEDAELLVYSSKSSTPDLPKWRAMVRAESPIKGKNWETLYNGVVRFFKALGITIDASLARPLQLVYLPNKGEHYQYMHRPGGAVSDVRIQKIYDWQSTLEAEIQQSEEAERAVRAERRANHDGDLTIDQFNRMPIEPLLDRYGFKRRGKSWVSPYSASGSPAVKVFREDNKAFSLSEGDNAMGLGSRTKSGGRLISSFDLYAHFEHRGDVIAAVKSLNKAEGAA